MLFRLFLTIDRGIVLLCGDLCGDGYYGRLGSGGRRGFPRTGTGGDPDQERWHRVVWKGSRRILRAGDPTFGVARRFFFREKNRGTARAQADLILVGGTGTSASRGDGQVDPGSLRSATEQCGIGIARSLSRGGHRSHQPRIPTDGDERIRPAGVLGS